MHLQRGKLVHGTAVINNSARLRSNEYASMIPVLPITGSHLTNTLPWLSIFYLLPCALHPPFTPDLDLLPPMS